MSISIALVFTYLSTLAQPLVAERLYNGLDRPVHRADDCTDRK